MSGPYHWDPIAGMQITASSAVLEYARAFLALSALKSKITMEPRSVCLQIAHVSDLQELKFQLQVPKALRCLCHCLGHSRLGLCHGGKTQGIPAVAGRLPWLILL